MLVHIGVNEMNKVKLIIPEGASEDVGYGLVELTHQICLKTEDDGTGGLGGRFGYGSNYENNVFMMHRFCWCESEDCLWCGEGEPNFLFKPTGAMIHWYKYIGRSQEQEGELPDNWLKQCIESIWDKDDCYYEIDKGSRNLSEVISGRMEPTLLTLCFSVSDENVLITIPINKFSENVIQYWDLETIIIEFSNWDMEGEVTEKLNILNEKYPKLSEKIRLDAIAENKRLIQWHKNMISTLKKKR